MSVISLFCTSVSSNSDVKTMIWLRENTKEITTFLDCPSLFACLFVCLLALLIHSLLHSFSGNFSMFSLDFSFAFSSGIPWCSQIDTGETLISLYLIRETNRIFYVWRPVMCRKPCLMWSLTNRGEYFWAADPAGPLLSVHLAQREWINIKRDSSIPGACLESVNLPLDSFSFLSYVRYNIKPPTIYRV